MSDLPWTDIPNEAIDYPATQASVSGTGQMWLALRCGLVFPVLLAECYFNLPGVAVRLAEADVAALHLLGVPVVTHPLGHDPRTVMY